MRHCQRCNRNFPDATNFCESCGGRLPDAASAAPGGPFCPNCGAVAEPGWRFCINCRAELPSRAVTWQYQQPIAPAAQPPASSAPPPPPPAFAAPRQEAATGSRIFVRCRKCRNLVEEDATFCDKCGASMTEESPLPPPPQHVQPLATPPPYIPRRYESDPAEIWTQGLNSGQFTPTTPAVTYLPQKAPSSPPGGNEKPAATFGIFESYAAPAPPSQSSKVAAIIAAAAILLTIAAVAVWYWWPQRGASAAAQSPTRPSSSPGQASASPGASPSASSTPAPATAGAADEEVKQIRQRRIEAQPSEVNQIIATISEAEKKYPTDYRFPYERAKLSIKGVVSHHEAFEPLFTAAEKAIDGGKADEMLSSLEADRDGDFYKLSRGHHEWATLEEALKDKDKDALKAGAHH